MQHHWIVLQQADTAGLARLAMEVPDRAELDAIEQRLRDKGIAVESGDGMASDRVDRYVRFDDPSGNPLELYTDMITMPTPPRARRVDLLDIQHVVLYQRDTREAHDFYTNIVGLNISDWIERMTAFMHFKNGWHHGIGVSKRGSSTHGLSHICFQPPDLDNVMRARAAVQKMNLPITQDILRHGPSGSVGFYYAGEDTVIEFSYGARNYAVERDFPRRILPISQVTVNQWKTGLEEYDDMEEKIVEEMRELAGIAQRDRTSIAQMLASGNRS
jgi:2,3-dihydroxy-p-cumate/2,3-dihydroxybenzoate 3,4-dioxygenase